MTPTATQILEYVASVQREALKREPNGHELAAGCAAFAAHAWDGMSAGYLRLPPAKPTREPKEPPKAVA